MENSNGAYKEHTSQVAHQAAAYPGLHSMKPLGVFLLPPGWDASPSQGYPSIKFTGTHFIYSWVDSEMSTVTMGPLCLPVISNNFYNVPQYYLHVTIFFNPVVSSSSRGPLKGGNRSYTWRQNDKMIIACWNLYLYKAIWLQALGSLSSVLGQDTLHFKRLSP